MLPPPDRSVRPNRSRLARCFAEALLLLSACCLLWLAQPRSARAELALELRDGWRLQSSALARARGAAISRPGFGVARWHRVKVPSTVVGALVDARHFPDPYVGMNLRALPGMDYPVDKRFDGPMAADSPFRGSWWYRVEFRLPKETRQAHVWLRLDGVNYRANVWLNGQRVASTEEIAGALRKHELEVTELVRPGAANALAIEVFAPEPGELAFNWADWNPAPPDKNMGLWGAVSLQRAGPLTISHAHVTSKLALPSLSEARLGVSCEVYNASDRPWRGSLRAQLEGREVASQEVTLAPRERQNLQLTSTTHAALVLAQPRVWWPFRMGSQELYRLELSVEVEGVVSDRESVRFGIQDTSSELTAAGHRLFKVNGKPLLVRGGGWAPDLLLRPKSRERLEAELRYVREMGLNTIRLEGKPESDALFELADELGITILTGFGCCDHWERWDDWDEEDRQISRASLRDQMRRLRNHPSVLGWFNASDEPPPPEVETSYLAIARELAWAKPILSSATELKSTVSGATGVKMLGPYDYVPPAYWLADRVRGGAFGFATEVGVGAAVPPIESLREMFSAEQLWPIGPAWHLHASIPPFAGLSNYLPALTARFGEPRDVESLARAAQALAYESKRALFEAYGRNKYVATGIIHWLLNSAWPGLNWQLYDYFLRPGGGYYGTKKACEPLHVQFSYDDRSVFVVNALPRQFHDLRVSTELFDRDLRVYFHNEAELDLAPDAAQKVLTVPLPKGLTGVHFLRLRVRDASGALESSNFYWLSTEQDVVDWASAQTHHTPTAHHADFSALQTLKATTLKLSSRLDEAGSAAEVTIENTGGALAFQVHLQVRDAERDREILPVYWEDNYFELMPGERRTLHVSHEPHAAARSVLADAWNAPSVRAEPPPPVPRIITAHTSTSSTNANANAASANSTNANSASSSSANSTGANSTGANSTGANSASASSANAKSTSSSGHAPRPWSAR